MSDFVHLHVHSEYSLLDGFSNIRKLVKHAKEIGMPALAITDHGNLFGVIDFFRSAQEFGVKPIIGMEAYLAARSMQEKDPQMDKRSTHLLLLAENQTGYRNLLKIASAAQLQGFYYYPRIDHDFLAAHAEGLIATSGCMSAEIPRLILQNNHEAARKKLDWYYDVFGPDNFFIELQSHNIPELPALNQNLREMGKRHQAKFVATNDVHYINPGDARLQDIMLCIQTGSLLSEPNRMRMTDDSYYLRPAAEMASLFADLPEALSNTLLIAERCNVDLNPTGYHLPEFDVPAGYTPQTYLRELCEAGLKNRYGSHAESPEIVERLEYELEIIHRMGFDAYFLIVWDLCQYAVKHNIWYNARGSAAGSIVAYCLEITLVDPIEHRLLFERFLNPDRISMPDIDLDFQDDLRHKIMEYCANKYGEDKVASIITFGKLKARAAVRDVARVLDIPLNEVDRIAKMIPNIPGSPVTIDETLELVPEFKQEYESKSYVRELLDTAKEMEDVVRNAGTHAAGVIITDRPVVDYIPLHRPTSNGDDTPIKTVTQFDMSTVDHLGLLKVDFLGLATLTIMARACSLIHKRHGIKLDLSSIPTDDPATYELLGKGETAGVFQFEGAGMRRWMMEMKPRSLDNAVAMVALFRPGPMDFIPQYIRRMHGEEDVSYRHKALEPLFKDTFGIAVYQEQLMIAAMELAGYTGSEADDLRKAISKKMAEKIAKHRKKFVAGAKNNGMPERTAADIFQDWENFARYGFNKSHAADYGTIAVQTAYLKTHYPVEYMVALLSVTKNDADKVAFYVSDCRRIGIKLLPPDVNRSDWDFAIEELPGGSPAIRFGLGAVKNVGHGPVETILRARGEKEFVSLEDFARRTDLRQVGKRALECLIKVGAFDSLGSRLAVLHGMDRIASLSANHFSAKERGQISFFGGEAGLEETLTLPVVGGGENRREQLNWERELIGLYISDHPLNPVSEKLDAIVQHHSSELPMLEHQENTRVAGMVTRIRRHMTKKGDPMGFLGIEDTQGEIDVVVFPRVWAKMGEDLQFDKVIVVGGKVDANGAEPKILAEKIWTDLEKVPKLKPSKNDVAPKESAPPKEQTDHFPSNSPHVITEPRPQPYSDDAEPPPPDTFPTNWEAGELEPQPPVYASGENPIAALSSKIGEDTPDPVSLKASNDLSSQPSDDRPVESVDPLIPVVIPLEKDVETLPKPILSPKPSAVQPASPVKLATLYIRSSGDKARDILRIRRIYGMLISYPGHDRFSFYVSEGSQGHFLEFPNDTTDLNGELRSRLEELLGAGNIQIEDITFQ